MATVDSGDPSSAAAEGHIGLIDELLARPFSAVSYRDGTDCGGPGHHLRILRASQDFWEDRDREAAQEEAEADLQADLDALVATLTAGETLSRSTCGST